MANERSIAGELFRYMGLGNSGVPYDTLAPRAQNQPSAEKEMADFIGNTAVGNPSIWMAYNSTMQRPGSYDEMLRLWDEMTSWDLLSTALTELVDEVTQADYSTGRTLWYECNDREVQTDLNKMADDLDVEEFLPSQTWYLTAFGNAFEKLHYEVGKGVQGMSWAHPMDVRRYWLVKTRKCIGFRWANNVPNKLDLYTQGNLSVPRVAIAAGTSQGAQEDLWYSWDFLHARRLYKHRMSEHGEPIFNEVQGIYKKLRMALDQMLVYRAQMQPDRYSISIDTQDQPPIEQMRTVQRWKQQFRMKLAFGQGGQTGGYGPPSDFKAYYDAQALDTVLWISKPKGFQHEITKLPGTSTVPDVYDIELLTNLFFSALRMPKSWLGIGDQTNGPASGKSLLAQDMRFLRAAKSIRRPIVSSYTWLGYFHALLKGKDVEKLNITAKMSDISSLEDQLRLELLSGQVELLEKIGGVLEQFEIPRHAMVELLFRKYMHLPDDVVNAVITALPAERPAQGESRKPAPSTRTLLRLVEDQVSGDPQAAELVRQLKDMNEYGPSRIPKLEGLALCKGHVLPTQSQIQESISRKTRADGAGDLVVSSYGEIPGLVKALSAGQDPSGKSAMNESQGYRRWGPAET